MAITPAATSYLGTMPPKTAGIEETWAFLRPGVDHIMTKLHKEALQILDYSNLQLAVFNFCTMGEAPTMANVTHDCSNVPILFARSDI
jgi:cullin 1